MFDGLFSFLKSYHFYQEGDVIYLRWPVTNFFALCIQTFWPMLKPLKFAKENDVDICDKLCTVPA